MKYGFINDISVDDNGIRARVSVDFIVDRSVLYEFMDCLIPIDGKAEREPIEAILNHSAKVVECSECGRTCEHVNGSYPRCPHCGAKVVNS